MNKMAVILVFLITINLFNIKRNYGIFFHLRQLHDKKYAVNSLLSNLESHSYLTFFISESLSCGKYKLTILVRLYSFVTSWFVLNKYCYFQQLRRKEIAWPLFTIINKEMWDLTLGYYLTTDMKSYLDI